MSLKTQLLTAVVLAPVEVSVLGGTFPARRMTTAILNDYEKSQQAMRSDMNGEGLNRTAAEFVLSSLLDEEGEPMSESVTADELMKVHIPGSINAAASKLLQLNYATLEGVEDAKKD